MRHTSDCGFLIAEAILAAFLMLFAFAASSLLFDTAIRWESEGGNARRAAMVAEKKMEDLRGLSADVPTGSTFSDVLSGLVGPQPDYPEAPGFTIDVEVIENRHRRVFTSGLTPSDGVHSPCSSLFTRPPESNENPPYDNPQLNNQYNTYPYSRHLADSLKLVQVTVTYGGNSKAYRLISLLGDPIDPIAKTSPSSPGPPRVVVTKVSGPNSLGDSDSAVYTAQVVTAKGTRPKDVTILWGLTLDSTGSLIFVPLDSSGRSVKVTKRPKVNSPGAQAKLQALVRYGGQEASGESAVIPLP